MKLSSTSIITSQLASLNTAIQKLCGDINHDLYSIQKEALARVSDPKAPPLKCNPTWAVRNCELCANKLSSMGNQLVPVFSRAFSIIESAEKANEKNIGYWGYGNGPSFTGGGGGHPFSGWSAIPYGGLALFTGIDFDNLIPLSSSDISALGINVSTDSDTQYFMAGSKIVGVCTNVTLHTSEDASIDAEVDVPSIARGQLSSIKGIALNSNNVSVEANEDGFEIGLSHQLIQDSHGNSLDASVSMIMTTGALMPMAPGLKVSTNVENAEVETIVTVESIPRKWNYYEADVAIDHELVENIEDGLVIAGFTITTAAVIETIITYLPVVLVCL